MASLGLQVEHRVPILRSPSVKYAHQCNVGRMYLLLGSRRALPGPQEAPPFAQATTLHPSGPQGQEEMAR